MFKSIFLVHINVCVCTNNMFREVINYNFVGLIKYNIKINGTICFKKYLNGIFCSNSNIYFFATNHVSHYVLENDAVDAFSERQSLKKNRRRCPLHRGGRSARRGRTVRGLVRGGSALWSDADGPRPGAGARVPCLTAGRSAL